jgi:hypothetical protein
VCEGCQLGDKKAVRFVLQRIWSFVHPARPNGKVWKSLILLTWRIWWVNNSSRWQMGFNLAFTGLSDFGRTRDRSIWGISVVFVWRSIVVAWRHEWTFSVFVAVHNSVVFIISPPPKPQSLWTFSKAFYLSFSNNSRHEHRDIRQISLGHCCDLSLEFFTLSSSRCA